MNIFTTTEKYAVVNILANIMKADGIIHPEEVKYINFVYNDLGITIGDLEEISNIDDLQAQLIIQAMSDEAKNRAHSMCVTMSEIDGDVDPRETEIIDRLFGKID